MKSLKSKLLIGFAFAIAMAYLESAVVVYLRMIYYPEGFTFPLQPIPVFVLWVEIGREAATIVMLYAVSRMLGTNARTIFAWFCVNFAAWDIWYYIWLKIFLDWPATLFDWDILFLIPLPWVGPVLAPVLVSLALAFAGIIILYFEENDTPLLMTKSEWWLQVSFGVLIIISFLVQNEQLSKQQLPEDYPWWLFILFLFVGLAMFFRRVLITRKASNRLG